MRTIKYLITTLLTLLMSSVQSQELDKLYYILGYNWDYSIPRVYTRNIKSAKMIFGGHESRMGELYRFSEVTGFKFKKGKREKDCINCHQLYTFIDIPNIYNLGNFYDIKHIKVTTNYYVFGDVEEEKQYGFFKPSVLENVTELQMKSFLAGVYLEAGSIRGDTINFVFRQAQNQRLTVMKDFINSIEKPKYLSVIHRQDEQDHCCGPTLFLVPNKILWDLFKNEEDRKKALVESFKVSK